MCGKAQNGAAAAWETLRRAALLFSKEEFMSHRHVTPSPPSEEMRASVPQATDPALAEDREVAQALSEVRAGKDASALSRRQFLLLGAAACGAAAIGASTPAQADILDTLNKVLYLDDIVLNYAHEMEELQYNFFTRGIAGRGYNDLEARERSMMAFIANQDREHFEALERTRDLRAAKGGGNFETPNASSSRQPRIFQFPRNAFRNRESLMAEAIAVKQNSVFAYHGAVDLVKDKRLLARAAAIAGVDGRHLAVLREMAGQPPVPTPFEGQVSPQIIGNRLARYGFNGGAMRTGGKIP
jgi:hypothetical protein